MKAFETDDTERRKLMEVSEHHKSEIKREIGSLTDNTKQLVANALLIGGALTLAYFAFAHLRADKEKKKKSKNDEGRDARVDLPAASPPSLFSQVGDAVIAQATLFLLDLAKEKLSDYLQKRKAKHENI